MNELQTLANYGLFDPAVDPAFNNNGSDSFTQSSSYWSSTTYANRPAYAWLVYFLDGSVGANNKTDTLYVRAVRGGP